MRARVRECQSHKPCTNSIREVEGPGIESTWALPHPLHLASEMPKAATAEALTGELPEWGLGEREPLLVTCPPCLLMAVPLRQRMNWTTQVMPALSHFISTEFVGLSLGEFYEGPFFDLTEGYRTWEDAARKLWGRAYWRSAQGLFPLMTYILTRAETGDNDASWADHPEFGCDWILMRRTLLLRPRSEVIPEIRGFGPSSWDFLAYYLTRYPPEENIELFHDLFCEVMGLLPEGPTEEGESPERVAVTRQMWLALLHRGVLHERKLL